MSKQQIFLQDLCQEIELIEILEMYLIMTEKPFSLNGDENIFWTLVMKYLKVNRKKLVKSYCEF